MKSSNRNIFLALGLGLSIVSILAIAGIAAVFVLNNNNDDAQVSQRSNASGDPAAANNNTPTDTEEKQPEPLEQFAYYQKDGAYEGLNLQTGEIVQTDLQTENCELEVDRDTSRSLYLSRYKFNSFAVQCNTDLYIFDDGKRPYRLDLSKIIGGMREASSVEMSQDGTFLAISVRDFSGGNYNGTPSFYIHNLKTGENREVSGDFTYENSGLVSGIIPLHFSTDNSKLFATNAAPAGYLADVVFEYDVQSGERTQLTAFDIGDTDKISPTALTGTKRNVDQNGNLYTWSYNEDSQETIIYSHNLETRDYDNEKRFSIMSQALTPSDFNTPIVGFDNGTVLLDSFVFFCDVEEMVSPEQCENEEEFAAFYALDYEGRKVAFAKNGLQDYDNKDLLDINDERVIFMDRNGVVGEDNVKATFYSIDRSSNEIEEIASIEGYDLLIGVITH